MSVDCLPHGPRAGARSGITIPHRVRDGECFEGRAGLDSYCQGMGHCRAHPDMADQLSSSSPTSCRPGPCPIQCLAWLRFRTSIRAAAHQSTPGPWCRGGVGLDHERIPVAHPALGVALGLVGHAMLRAVRLQLFKRHALKDAVRVVRAVVDVEELAVVHLYLLSVSPGAWPGRV